MGKIYNQLNIDDREMIATLKAQGNSARQIGEAIGRSHSTVVRELKRNSAPIYKCWYLSHKNVLVERKSRFTKITKLKGKTSKQTRMALNRRLCRHPEGARLSITYDNGSENVEHDKVNKTLGTLSYFCNPYHSWEKGTVENTAGLIRRYVPKKTDISKIADAHIKRMERQLNNRPRKCLDYQTPAEVFDRLCGALAG